MGIHQQDFQPLAIENNVFENAMVCRLFKAFQPCISLFRPSERSLSGLGVLLTLMPCPWSAGEFLSKKFQLLGCPLWQSQGTIIHHLEETDKKFNSNHQKGLSFRKKKKRKQGKKETTPGGMHNHIKRRQIF